MPIFAHANVPKRSIRTIARTPNRVEARDRNTEVSNQPSPAVNGSTVELSPEALNSRSVTGSALPDVSQMGPQPPSSTQPQAETSEKLTIRDLSGRAENGGFYHIDEDEERRLLKENNGKPLLVKIYSGDKGGVAVSAHGINGEPDDLDKLHQVYADQGKDVYAYLYPDRHGRLDKMADGLASGLRQLEAENPGEDFDLALHSMGNMIGHTALDKNAKAGELNANYRVQSIAPPFQGSQIGRLARTMPPFVAVQIPTLGPGLDMAPGSPFQKNLRSIELPSNVKTEVTTGDHDKLVKSTNGRYQDVVEGLNAKEFEPVVNGTHMSVIDDVARRLREEMPPAPVVSSPQPPVTTSPRSSAGGAGQLDPALREKIARFQQEQSVSNGGRGSDRLDYSGPSPSSSSSPVLPAAPSSPTSSAPQSRQENTPSRTPELPTPAPMPQPEPAVEPGTSPQSTLNLSDLNVAPRPGGNSGGSSTDGMSDATRREVYGTAPDEIAAGEAAAAAMRDQFPSETSFTLEPNLTSQFMNGGDFEADFSSPHASIIPILDGELPPDPQGNYFGVEMGSWATMKEDPLTANSTEEMFPDYKDGPKK